MPPVKKSEKIDVKNINETVTLSKKILKLLYVCMIIGLVLAVTVIIQKWAIPKFIINFVKLLVPLFIGYVIAWLFNPLVTFLQKNGFKRGIAVAIVYVGFLSLLYLFMSMLVPTVISQFNDLVSSLPNVFNSIKDFFDNFFANLNNIDTATIGEIQNKLYANVGNIFNSIVEDLPNKTISILSSLISGVGTFIISLLVGFYMLFDFDSIQRHFLKLIPKKYRFEIGNLVDEIAKQLRKYVNGVLGVASIVLFGCSIGFAIIGLKAPLLFGMFCGITDLIPYVGPYIGGAAAVIVGFSQSPATGILALIIIIIFQVLESYIIQPIVMSKTMKLHPVTILIGLIVFGSFFGIAGMVLATPIIALLKIIFRFINNKYHLIDLDI